MFGWFSELAYCDSRSNRRRNSSFSRQLGQQDLERHELAGLPLLGEVTRRPCRLRRSRSVTA